MNELHLGELNKDCACCRRLFSGKVIPAGNVRVEPLNSPFPISFEYRICAKCVREFKRGGKRCRQSSRRVNAYHMGDSA